MKLSLHVPTPLEYFGALVRSDRDFPLLEAATCIAHDEYPELDVESVLAGVDRLAQRLQRQIPADAGPMERLRRLNDFFFSQLGFAGNVNHYMDAENSYIHVVLERRRGIPVSLAVIWLELARALALHAHGVSFPGHFLVKVGLPQGWVVLDPLTGRSLGMDELAGLLRAWRQTESAGRNAASFDPPVGLHLQNALPREIIGRMLDNLRELHRTFDEPVLLRAVLDRVLLLRPDDLGALRERGVLHAREGRVDAALRDLETYLRRVPRAVDAPAIGELVLELRARHGGTA
jgi:regulator of sirC expression with transglutaminase-like and TPR domain